MKKTAFIIMAGLMLAASCTKKAAPTTTTAAADGAALFGANCAKCHGATGVEGRAPHLNDLSLTAAQINDVIVHGKGHMPPFGDKLTGNEVKAVTGFVTGLKK